MEGSRFRLVAGLDEAGRGPAIGPMVIAGVALDEDRVPELLKMGVKDSKKLTPKRRGELVGPIMDIITSHRVQVIGADEIDTVRKVKNLNLLEAEVMSGIISYLKPELAQVGSVDVNTTRFSQAISRGLGFIPKIRIVSVHQAEDRFPAVAAASIIAKTTRDRIVSDLREKYGDFGSGYPNDPKTRAFIATCWDRKRALPPLIRRSWKTTISIREERYKLQKKLEF